MTSDFQSTNDSTIVPCAFFSNEKDSVPNFVEDLTWGELIEILSVHEESPCEIDGKDKCRGRDCPYKSNSAQPNKPMAFMPAVIQGNRSDVNVKAITFAALDHDHLSNEEGIDLECKLAPYEHFIYTTHSHRIHDGCVRSLVLTDRFVLADEYPFFRRALVAYLDVRSDPSTKDRARLYYLPSHSKGAPFGVSRHHGKRLCVDEVLAWAAEHPEKIAPIEPETAKDYVGFTGVSGSGSSWDLDGQYVCSAIDVLSEAFPTQGRRHEFCMALAGMLRRAGATEEDAYHIVREVAERGGSGDPDARAKVVTHTYRLADDAALTGFTRLAEIVGEAVAERAGNEFVDARNEAFWRGVGVSRVPGTHALPASTRTAVSAPSTSAPFPVAPAVPEINLDDLRRVLFSLKRRKFNSDDLDDLYRGVLVHRVLAGIALSDNLPEDSAEHVPYDAKKCVGSVIYLLAYKFPVGTPWEATLEILRKSLTAMVTAERDFAYWAHYAEDTYRRACEARLISDAKSAMEGEAYRQRIRAITVTTSAQDSDEDIEHRKEERETENTDEDTIDPEYWKTLVKMKPDGKGLLPIYNNASIILRYHPDFYKTIRWNEITKQVEVKGGVLGGKKYSKIEDLATAAQDYLSSVFDLSISYNDLVRRIMKLSRENKYDPLKDYLLSHKWDGVKRISTWLPTYCGAEDKEYTRRIGRMWLIALVARGLTPGCKVDNVLVLEAPPGIGKSTVFEILGGEWFCDTAINLGDKDSRMLASQYWVIELAELVAFKRSDRDTLKQFFSSRVDKFRPPYSASMEESPRRCLFVGTTNEYEYLTDETGNRKYWPAKCSYTHGALKCLREDRDQLFAEAVEAFHSGESWWFEYNEIGLSETEAEERMVETPARVKVSAWWYALNPKNRPEDVSTMEVAEAALEMEPKQIKPGDLMQIGHALKKMGFRRQRSTSGTREYRYFAPPELRSAEQVSMKQLAKPSVTPGYIQSQRK